MDIAGRKQLSILDRIEKERYLKMTEKKELAYFQIGSSFGGNQRWMTDPWMHIGGCAALTSCDALICLALQKNRPELYPYDLVHMTKKDYKKFAMSMKLYLRPRNSGIKDLDTYIEGFRNYLEDVEVTDIQMRGLSGHEDPAEAKAAICAQIDAGIPVPYLMLKHQDKQFDFFDWHWFLIIGYEQRGDACYIKAATYGEPHWLPLERLWDTGQEEKGGIVLLEMNAA